MIMPPDHAVFLNGLRMEVQQAVEATQHGGQSAATLPLDQSSVGRVLRMDALQQ